MNKINRLRISRFKCFVQNEFTLKDITILTGGNGAGKSSLIQAILLARTALERSKFKGELGGNSGHSLVPLNGEYGLQLGTVFDIIREGDYKESNFLVTLDDDDFVFSLPNSEAHVDRNDDTVVAASFNLRQNQDDIFWAQREFYYLNTERLGPRYQLASTSSYTDYVHCGFNGEYTGKVILNIEADRKYTSAMMPSRSSLFSYEVNRWLGHICPGISISVIPLNALTAQIRISNTGSKQPLTATNIGFGISYVLPIIVSGLIAKKGAMLVVENPEAHLHPKAQSNIGYFLGIVASAGVKVLIETHSEHVVNGIRKASLPSIGLAPENAIIYFFNGFNEDGNIALETINITGASGLDKFPLDFFDQLNQDTGEIIKANLKSK